MSRIVLSLLAVTTLATAACGKKKDGGGASCDQVVAHTAELLKQELPADAKSKMVQKCESGSQAQRDCAMKATSLEELGSCK